jgi:hypothetical protein
LEYLSFSDRNTCLFCSIVADIFKCFQVFSTRYIQVFSSVFNSLTDFALFVCMCCPRQDSVEDIETLAETQYPSVQATKFGAALKAVPKLSKHLVAYMEGLLALSPYVNGPFYSRAKGVAEAVAAVALSDLNQLANEPYKAHLKRKLGEWYREAPRPAHKQPAVDADEPAPLAAANDQEEATEADAVSGGATVEATAVGLYSISKVFRPECDPRGAPERRRAPDRDRAVPGLHSAEFGSRSQ